MTPHAQDSDFAIYHADGCDVLREIEAAAIVTSPPYLDARPEYGHPTEEWWDDFFRIAAVRISGPALINVGRLWREGVESLWWASLIAVAARHGWKHRDTLVWIKPNANPIHGRLFVDRHEYVLCLSTDAADDFNTDEIRVPYADSSAARMQRGWANHTSVKNSGDSTRGRKSSDPHPDGGRAPSYVVGHTGGEKGNPHPAPMPLDVALHLVRLAALPGRTVFDPFGGSGTTALACRRSGRSCVMAELDADYVAIAAGRLAQLSLLAEVGS